MSCAQESIKRAEYVNVSLNPTILIASAQILQLACPDEDANDA